MPDASQLDPLERAVVLILKQERERQKISATQLAAKIKVSRTTVTHLESDHARPTFWVLLKIADGLGIKLESVIVEARKKKKQ